MTEMNRRAFEGGGDGWEPGAPLFGALDCEQEICFALE